MSSIEELTEKILILETEKKSQDREIKEVKEKIEILTTSFNGQALTIQSILYKVDNLNDNFNSKVDNLTKGFDSISNYIEELKSQPKKELNKYISLIIGALFGGVCYVIGSYFKK